MNQASRFTRTILSVFLSQFLLGVGWQSSSILSGQTRSKVATVSLYPNVKQERVRRDLPSNARIRLGDIAKVYTADEKLKLRLSHIDLGDWPGPEQTTVISKQLVRIRIQLGDFGPVKVQVVGNDRVTIEGKAKVKPVEKKSTPARETPPIEKELVSAISQAAAERYGVSHESVFVELKSTAVFSNPKYRVPQNSAIEIISDSLPLIGTIQLSFLAVSKESIGQGKVTASILVSRQVATATELIPSGALISKENVQLRKRIFNSIAIDQALGAEAFGSFSGKRIIRGMPVRSSDLGAKRGSGKIAVRRGDAVQATVVKNSLRLKMTGLICTQSGKIGDRILVENPTSQRRFIAEVVSPNEVMVR